MQNMFKVVFISLLVVGLSFGCGSDNKTTQNNNNSSTDVDGGSTDNGNTDNNSQDDSDVVVGSTINTLSLQKAKDIYGYELTFKFKSTDNQMTSTIITTFDCQGNYTQDQVINAAGYTEQAPTLRGDTVKLEVVPTDADKMFLWWDESSTAENKGAAIFFDKDNVKIVVNETKLQGSKQTVLNQIKKVQKCN